MTIRTRDILHNIDTNLCFNFPNVYKKGTYVSYQISIYKKLLKNNRRKFHHTDMYICNILDNIHDEDIKYRHYEERGYIDERFVEPLFKGRILSACIWVGLTRAVIVDSLKYFKVDKRLLINN